MTRHAFLHAAVARRQGIFFDRPDFTVDLDDGGITGRPDGDVVVSMIGTHGPGFGVADQDDPEIADVVVDDLAAFEIGERPTPGQALLVMLSGEQPYARIYVPEQLRINVGPGIRADIFVDGLEEPLRGTVRWVASEAAFTPYFALTERDRGRLTYEAKVDIDTERQRFPDGVPVEVELDIESGDR